MLLLLGCGSCHHTAETSVSAQNVLRSLAEVLHAEAIYTEILDLLPTQVRAAVAAMGVVAPEGTLVRTGGRLHPSPSFAVAPSEAEPEERGDENGGGGDDSADASAGDGAIAVAQLHRQVWLPRLHSLLPTNAATLPLLQTA